MHSRCRVDAIQFRGVSITFDSGDARKLQDRSGVYQFNNSRTWKGDRCKSQYSTGLHGLSLCNGVTRVNVTDTTFPVIFEPNDQ